MNKDINFYNTTIEHTKKDSAFCKIDINGELKTIRIASKFLLKALDGDDVLLKVKNNKYGFVQKILKRKEHILIGKITLCDKYAFIKPWSSNYHRDFFVLNSDIPKGICNDDVVEFELDKWVKKDKNPRGKIIKKLDNATPEQYLLHKLNLPTKFPDNVLNETKKLKWDISNKELNKRLDIRYLDVFSIDPDGCTDIDDALSIEKIDNGYKIGIHIADVSYWVTSGSELDKEAYSRSFTTYLPHMSVPMIPSNLSSGLCSLVQDNDRYAVSLFFYIDESWNIYNKELKRTIIRNNKTFTYEEAEKHRNDKDSSYHHRLNLLYTIGSKLRKESFPKEIIFNNDTTEWVLDKENNPIKIKKKKRIITMDLIQSWMLLANKTVTELIEEKKNIPWIYREHKDIIPDQVNNLKKDYKQLDIIWNDSLSNEDNINNAIKTHNDSELVSEITIKKLRPANYTHIKKNHYAIGSDQYTHFTSPIRRYTDIIIHRILLNVIENKPIFKDSFETQCVHISKQEKKIDRIEKKMNKMLCIKFIKDIDYDISSKIIEFSKKGIYVKTEFGICGWILPKNIKSKWNGDSRKWDIGNDENIGDIITVKYSASDEDSGEIYFKII